MLKAAKNTLLGETWQERGEAPDWQRLYERREGRLGIVPRGGLILTAGADVQHDRIEVDVWAWGRRLESWLVDHVVLEGDTSRQEVWDRLTALLGRTWRNESGASMRLARLAVDSGDGRTTAAVYAWARRAGAGQAIAVKGVHGFDRSTPVDGPTYVDLTEGGRKIRRGAKVWSVSVAVFKSETYRFLRLDRPTDEEIAEGVGFPDGYIHIPLGVTAEWIKQLTAEQLVTVRDRRGFTKLEWRQMRDRNEALDCRVYARAAAWLVGIDRWDERRWEHQEMQIDAARHDDAAAGDVKPSPPQGEIRRSGWFSRHEGWF
jgi:phage terminase large subunit GpA-like protein